MPRGSQRATPSALVHAQVALEGFTLTPDGSAAIYAVRRVRRGAYETHLWWRALDGGRPRQLTRGRVRDSAFAVSPDGRWLAFVRSQVAEAGVAQAWVLPLEAGEPWRLTSLPHDVSGIAWSPTGDRLALVAAGGAPRFIVGTERAGRAPTARRITRLDFRDDASGHIDRRIHLWLLPFRRGAKPRQLTDGDYDVSDVAWFPDGRRIAFAADRGPDANIDPRLQLWAVSTESRRPRISELASLAGDAHGPAFSPDGRHLAFLGTDVADPPDEIPTELWVMALPSGKPRNLTKPLDRSIGDLAWCDLLMAEDAPGPVWIDDRSIAVTVGTNGRNIPYSVDLDGGLEPMVDPTRAIAANGVRTAAGRVAVSAAVDGGAGEVWEVASGVLRQVTREGSAWMRRFPRVVQTEVLVDGPGGQIQAWLGSPVAAGRRALPTVLIVHGGPTGAWGPGGTLDQMALCAAGYRVLRPNVRGSDTFGRAWVRALGGDWGGPDAADAHATIDWVVEHGLADPKRLTVMGYSYGGFMTLWLAATSDRFAAAAPENAVTNQVSAWANSYFGVHYARRARLGDPLTERGARRMWRTSPLRLAASMHTPMLMLQAEDDAVCPAADNEQLFTALKVLGRDVEYILYPEEHHEMKNYGRPDRRTDRLERIVTWFDRHVKPR